MASEHAIARDRRWYRRLLGCYSRSYRERFAASMDQTFNDLCQERAAAGKGLAAFAIWMYFDTAVGVFQEQVRSMPMQTYLIRLTIVVGLLLLVPLWGNYYVDGWNWDLFDFIVIGALLYGTGLTYGLVARKGGNLAYRIAVGIACAAGLLLVWVNAAVGIIGDEELANAMYLGVLAVGFVGIFVARFEPRGRSRAMLATAAAQVLVPLLAMTWVPEERFSPGYVPVMCLNAVFVAAWVVSALLFHHAGNANSTFRVDVQGSGPSRNTAAD